MPGQGGRGPAPAENKRRRNRDQYEGEKVTVPADADVDAPKLPNAKKYLPATREWYATWCRSPQAATFTATDWQRLHMLAPIVDAYWQEPSTKLFAEIRQNESLLGATHADRLRARITVDQSQKKTPEASGTASKDVPRLDDRRRRITDAS